MQAIPTVTFSTRIKLRGFGHNMNVCSMDRSTKKYVTEKKEVLYGLVFDKTKQGICNTKEHNRVAWFEFLFPWIASRSFEASPSFYPATPPCTKLFHAHFFSAMMVTECIYVSVPW